METVTGLEPATQGFCSPSPYQLGDTVMTGRQQDSNLRTGVSRLTVENRPLYPLGYDAVFGCGGRTRTCDLEVMGLTSYQLLYPAVWRNR